MGPPGRDVGVTSFSIVACYRIRQSGELYCLALLWSFDEGYFNGGYPHCVPFSKHFSIGSFAEAPENSLNLHSLQGLRRYSDGPWSTGGKSPTWFPIKCFPARQYSKFNIISARPARRCRRHFRALPGMANTSNSATITLKNARNVGNIYELSVIPPKVWSIVPRHF